MNLLFADTWVESSSLGDRKLTWQSSIVLVRDSTLHPLLYCFPGVLDAVKAQALELLQGRFSDLGDLSSHILWTP